MIATAVLATALVAMSQDLPMNENELPPVSLGSNFGPAEESELPPVDLGSNFGSMDENELPPVTLGSHYGMGIPGGGLAPLPEGFETKPLVEVRGLANVTEVSPKDAIYRLTIIEPEKNNLIPPELSGLVGMRICNTEPILEPGCDAVQDQGKKKTPAPFKRPAFCLLAEEVGPCRAFFSRYAYDPTRNACRLFVYGGCQGNENNFETLDQCKQVCMGVPKRSEYTLRVRRGEGTLDYSTDMPVISSKLTLADEGNHRFLMLFFGVYRPVAIGTSVVVTTSFYVDDRGFPLGGASLHMNHATECATVRKL